MEKNKPANPYDDMDKYLENDQQKKLQNIRENVDMTKRHTDVYRPKPIKEFAKHMDARPRAKNISYLCISVVSESLAAFIIYLFIDAKWTLLPFIAVYSVLIITLAALINKGKSKSIVIAYEVLAAVCVLLGIIFSSSISQICGNTSKLLFAYLPLAAQCVLRFFIYRLVWEFHEAFESYLTTGEVPPYKSKLKDKTAQIDEWLKYR